VVGVALLFGIVLAGAALIFLSGVLLQENLDQRNRMEATEQSMLALESDVGDLTQTTDNGTVEFDAGPASDATTTIHSGDTLTLRLNRDADCAGTVHLEGVRSDLPDGGTFFYQAGGVWKETDAGTTMVSPPDVRYRNGTVSVRGIRVADGESGDGDFTVRERPEASAAATEGVRESLFSEPKCYRPDDVTLVVESDRLHARWYEYLREEFPETASVSYAPGAGRVEVTLGHEHLPSRVDDSENHVVDFTEDDDMGRVDDGDEELVVDKGAGNEYDVSMELLDVNVGYNESEYRTETVWDNRTVEFDENASRPPLDVLLVIDQSGSMGEPIAKLEGAKRGSKALLGWLLGKDRVGVASFADGFHLRQGLTRDRDAAKGAIDTIPADGGTHMQPAIRNAHNHLKHHGNDSHDQVIVFLGDGIPDDGKPGIRNAVEDANDDGIEIHTIALGGGADESLLSDMATRGNGSFHDVDDADDLEDAFEDIAGEVSGVIQYNNSTTRSYWDRRIVHPPVAMTVEVGPASRHPFVDASSPSASGINYPGPDSDEFGERLGDGEQLDLEAVGVLECLDEERTEETVSPAWNASKTYNHTRCRAPGSLETTSDDVRLYVDGDAIPSDSTKWWQPDLAGTLPGRVTNDTDGDGDPDVFDLESNQVVATFRMDDHGTTDRNNVVVLVEVGDSRTEATARWVVDVEESVIEVEND